MAEKLQNKAFLFVFSTLYFKVVKQFGLLQLECGLPPSGGHIREGILGYEQFTCESKLFPLNLH